MKTIKILLILAVLLTACSSEDGDASQGESFDLSTFQGGGLLRLATTTSTENSGLLDYLLPEFEVRFEMEIQIIAVGTGQALQLGEDGNVDVLLVHAPSMEQAYMEDEHGIRRELVMYNDFVIVGPADDPADIAGMDDAVDALENIAEAQATFVSRGDESGTHLMEETLWEAAGLCRRVIGMSAPAKGWAPSCRWRKNWKPIP